MGQWDKLKKAKGQCPIELKLVYINTIRFVKITQKNTCTIGCKNKI